MSPRHRHLRRPHSTFERAVQNLFLGRARIGVDCLPIFLFSLALLLDDRRANFSSTFSRCEIMYRIGGRRDKINSNLLCSNSAVRYFPFSPLSRSPLVTLTSVSSCRSIGDQHGEISVWRSFSFTSQYSIVHCYSNFNFNMNLHF